MDENNQKQVEEVIALLETNLSAGNFDIVDLWLKNADLTELNSAAIIGALTMTYWGKDKLVNRQEFLNKAEPLLKERLGEERAEKLLLRRR